MQHDFQQSNECADALARKDIYIYICLACTMTSILICYVQPIPFSFFSTLVIGENISIQARLARAIYICTFH
jgi:hypothetical protein